MRRRDVTHQYPEMTANIGRIADTIAGNNSAHELHLYRPCSVSSDLKKYTMNGKASPELDLVLHTTFDAHAPLSKVHAQAEEIKRALRQAYPNLGSVVIHTEPPEG